MTIDKTTMAFLADETEKLQKQVYLQNTASNYSYIPIASATDKLCFPGPFSICAKFQVASLSAGGASIIGKGNAWTQGNYYINLTGGGSIIYFATSDGSVNANVESGITLNNTDTIWVVAVATSSILQIFVRQGNTYREDQEEHSLASFYTSDQAITIFKNPYLAYCLRGKLYKAKFYNFALTRAQARAFCFDGDIPNSIGHFPIVENSGAYFYDYSQKIESYPTPGRTNTASWGTDNTSEDGGRWL